MAEKPSIAKIIATYLSDSSFRTEKSNSEYNPIYNFTGSFLIHEYVTHKVTSVTGHIEELQFEEKYNDWRKNNPVVLIESAGIIKKRDQSKLGIVTNIKQLTTQCDDLVLWLDCDREGESICFEVLEICFEVKRSFGIHRAHFSAATKEDILRAMTSLKKPNPFLHDVDWGNQGSLRSAGDRPQDRSCL